MVCPSSFQVSAYDQQGKGLVHPTKFLVIAEKRAKDAHCTGADMQTHTQLAENGDAIIELPD
jgi:hypothetical protein